jgi:hypothetical protein
MKRPKTMDKEYEDRIAGEGAKAAWRKFEASRRAIRKAMEDIKADVEKNDGVYLAGRKITTAEVLERAGKSPSYLYKKQASQDLKNLRAEVGDFVDRMAAGFPSDIHAVHQVVAGRARDAKSELELVMNNYAAAELELGDARADLRGKTKTIEELETRVTDLLKQLAGRTVVDLPTRRK